MRLDCTHPTLPELRRLHVPLAQVCGHHLCCTSGVALAHSLRRACSLSAVPCRARIPRCGAVQVLACRTTRHPAWLDGGQKDQSAYWLAQCGEAAPVPPSPRVIPALPPVTIYRLARNACYPVRWRCRLLRSIWPLSSQIHFEPHTSHLSVHRCRSSVSS